MDRYAITVMYVDGSSLALTAEAANALEAQQEIIARLAEQFIEWPPQLCPQQLRAEHATYSTAAARA